MATEHKLKAFTVDIDSDGIATFFFDVPGRTMNTFTEDAVVDLNGIVEAIKNDPSIKGAVLASGKNNAFCAGADIGEMSVTAGAVLNEADRAAELQKTSRMSRHLRALETVGKPVVAALEGLALGGGFEFALAAHRRVASPKAKIGLPEVTIGLLPGGGGTQRVPRLAGAKAAFDLIISGAPIDAERAFAQNLVDEIVEPGKTIDAAKRWIREGGEGIQPWDRPGFSLPDGPYTKEGNPFFINMAGIIKSKSYGNYPAQDNIARCIYEGYGLAMDPALALESRLFLDTMLTSQARAMLRSVFISRQELAKGAARPKSFPQSEVKKATVLGAGMMGAGIAYAQASSGIETVLIDRTVEFAEQGKDYSRKICEKGVAAGKTSSANADALLGRIQPAQDYDAVSGSDIVIEAVFEDRTLKADVTRKAEAQITDAAVMASNTSTLPIDGLADASERPGNFIGIHFFSPVDRMELVEIIVGKRTDDHTLAKAIDYCRQIRKVPIVVNDSRGFYTSRVFETYTFEGMELLLDGIAPAIIDNVGRMTGMPRGPLELLDDVAIELVDSIAAQKRRDLGLSEPNGGIDKVLKDMVAADRLGRKNGNGFYDYPKGEAKKLWPGLAEMYPATVTSSTPELIETIKQRLLYRQAVEAARCMDEGVVREARDADVGALLGWNFARWTGGPISLIDSVGVGEFVKRCDGLAKQFGERFEPPTLLRKMAAEGETFYPPVRRSA